MLMVYIQSEYILKHSKLLRRAGWNQAGIVILKKSITDGILLTSLMLCLFYE
jgi:hypothetical protein